MIDLVAHGLHFRPIANTDEALLNAIYASTRSEEMALVTYWTDEEKAAFLQQQFQAQHTYYQQMYPDARFLVILWNEQPAGRLYLHYRKEEIRIVDIALLPDFRNRGFGQQILGSVLAEAAGLGLSVSIHVERMNPALQLYERLGFQVISEENQVYLLLRWKAKSD